ncbi:HDOD domain-containing protein [Sulfidibacter corallicola]|uniref:HDOD domain-containing protein n=1 Tax=Sulfidibacter corallicola TaxID=2818388 RepID=A0A8A4TUF2_SULCO|nr:HDOD domain-containing protein [Sulfidibacter corallicola]QTD52764.1 HDOD domain-containing protein [Sulfidibacter corallicola]
MNDRTREAMEKLDQFPPFTNATLAIIDLLANGDYDTDQLAALIETDLTLAARCLKQINAPIYGFKEDQVTDIRRAVTLLGSETIYSIALETSLQKVLKHPLEGYQAKIGEFRRHSLRTAIGARRMMRFLFEGRQAEEAYAAGLLHDIGKVVLSDLLGSRIDEARQTLKDQPNKDFLVLEKTLFDLTHPEIGATLAKRWNLPPSLETAIRYHHRPSEAPQEHRDLCLAVHFGDMFAMMTGSATEIDSLAYAFDPVVDTLIKRDRQWELVTYPKLLLEIDEEFQRAMGLTDGNGEKHP